MRSYVIVHVLRLKSGMFVARSTEFPDCVGRSFEPEGAVRLLERSLIEKIVEMTETGEVAPLFSYDELQVKWATHTRTELDEPERLPGNRDVFLIRRLGHHRDLKRQSDAA